MQEEWKPCYNGPYEASTKGRVRKVVSDRNGTHYKILKPHQTEKGYVRVCCRINGKQRNQRVHRLVAAAFIGPCPTGEEINHKDGKKTNNDISNLQYVTPIENRRHAVRNGLYQPKLKYSQVVVDRIRSLREDGHTFASIATAVGVSHSYCWNVVHYNRRRRVWK